MRSIRQFEICRRATPAMCVIVVGLVTAMCCDVAPRASAGLPPTATGLTVIVDQYGRQVQPGLVIPFEFPFDMPPSAEFARHSRVPGGRNLFASLKARSQDRTEFPSGTELLNRTTPPRSPQPIVPFATDLMQRIHETINTLPPSIVSEFHFRRSDVQPQVENLSQLPLHTSVADLFGRMTLETRRFQGAFAAELTAASTTDYVWRGVFDHNYFAQRWMKRPVKSFRMEDRWNQRHKFPPRRSAAVDHRFWSRRREPWLAACIKDPFQRSEVDEFERLPVWMTDPFGDVPLVSRLDITEVEDSIELYDWYSPEAIIEEILGPSAAAAYQIAGVELLIASGKPAIQASTSIRRGPVAELELRLEFMRASMQSPFGFVRFRTREPIKPDLSFVYEPESQPPPNLNERVHDALFSTKIRRLPPLDRPLKGTTIHFSSIRHEPKLPIWVAPVVRQNLDDATVGETKQTLKIWSRPFGDGYGSTGTYR